MVEPESAPVVVTVDSQSDHPVDMQRWSGLAARVLEGEGFGATSELHLSFVDVAAMTDLNVEHMDGTGPTDVLSFPLEPEPYLLLEGGSEVGTSDETAPPMLLGDVVICPQVVHGQAKSSPDDEMALMVFHGVLHILGMDHQLPDEARVMSEAEQRHLSAWRESVSAS